MNVLDCDWPTCECEEHNCCDGMEALVKRYDQKDPSVAGGAIKGESDTPLVTPPQSRSGREIFEAIVLGKEWDFTDAEFESAVLDRQHTYPVLTQKGIDCASGATVDVEVSNILPINGSDFSGEIRNMLAALAHRIREINAAASEKPAQLPGVEALVKDWELHPRQIDSRWASTAIRSALEALTR